MDSFPALDVWDLVIEVLHSSQNILHRETDRAKRLKAHTHTNHTPNTKTKMHSNREVDELSNHVVASAKTSHSEASITSFEENEAVIKRIL